MINVSDDWKLAQKRSLLPEGELRLTISKFENFASGNIQAVLTRSDIVDFSYKATGSIVGKETPFTEAVLKVFKTSLPVNSFKMFAFVKVEVGLHVDEDDDDYVEWHLYDILQIIDQKTPANGNFATYRMAMCGYQGFEATYDLGSGEAGVGIFPYAVGNRIIDYQQRKGLFPNQTILDYQSVMYNCGRSLQACSTKDALLYCAQCYGTTFYARPYLYQNNGDDTTGLKIYFKAFDKDLPDNDYQIDWKTCYKFPESSIENITKGIFSVYTSDYKRDNNNNIETAPFSKNYSSVYVGQRNIFRWEGEQLYNHNIPANSRYTIELTGNALMITWNAIPSLLPVTLSGSVAFMATNIEKEEVTLAYGTGDTIEIDNPLVTSLWLRSYIELYLSEWIKEQELFDIEYRIDPRIQLFDKIRYKDDDGEIITLVVETLEWSYNGAFKGKLRGRKYKPNRANPEVTNLDYDENDWTLTIKNNNIEDAVLKFQYSYAGTIPIEIPVSAGESVTLNANNCSALNGSFYAKSIGTLEHEVYCWFTIDGTDTGNTIVLEED